MKIGEEIFPGSGRKIAVLGEKPLFNFRKSDFPQRDRGRTVVNEIIYRNVKKTGKGRQLLVGGLAVLSFRTRRTVERATLSRRARASWVMWYLQAQGFQFFVEVTWPASLLDTFCYILPIVAVKNMNKWLNINKVLPVSSDNGTWDSPVDTDRETTYNLFEDRITTDFKEEQEHMIVAKNDEAKTKPAVERWRSWFPLS